MNTTKNATQIKAEPGKQEIFITRDFEAPRELVFKALTDPSLVVQWLGPKDITMTIDQFNIKNNGHYRYIHSRGQHSYAFRGVVHEVSFPERIIQTFEFEGLSEKGHVALETARLEALPGGRTRLTTHSVFQSVADRDGMLQSGMEKGVLDSHDRLDSVLEKLSS
ncbi:MAG TPA: SRPBCC family protein [Chitinophagaceae bacterium]|nr:SRPBCC family protein [Chitinophagaceae bacterium]